MTPQSHRPPAAFTILLFALLFLAACSSDQLPPDYYGSWILTGSGGGIDGRWEESSGTNVSFQLKTGNTAVFFHDGKPVRTVAFSVSHGDTIFGPAWLIRFDDRTEPEVIQLPDRDTLTLSMNAYDGFGATYLRAP